MTPAIDNYLATALKSVMEGHPAAPWPAQWAQDAGFADGVATRIIFHGIALVLLRDTGKLATWPETVRTAIREEARAQAFWETGHRTVLLRMLAALKHAGAHGTITKGSALAYAVYPEPALRRRGDSDILLAGAPRNAVRRALRAAGFQQRGDTRPLQESWAAECSLGFIHQFDLHWRINASATLAGALERAGIGTRSALLPRLSEDARGIAPADNLILVALNRASHETFGYQSGRHKLFDQDRLIWALDVDLLCRTFTLQDWNSLLAASATSGTGPLVANALAFAARTLETPIPDTVARSLEAQPGNPQLLEYLGQASSLDRLKGDLGSSPGLLAKLRLVGYHLFPGAEVLHERFPDATHWPQAVLQGRRLVASARKLIRPRP